MTYTIKHKERFVEITGEGIELTYIILHGEKFGTELNTTHGVVEGTGVQNSKGTADYWIKVGRGKLKQSVQEQINKAESHLAEQGFIIKGIKPAYRR